MPNITLAVTEQIHKEMREFPEIKWSEVVRSAIEAKLETLRLAEKLASKSKLTQKDVEEFSNKMKAIATKRFLK